MQEKTCKRGVSPTPHFPAPLPTSHASDRRRPGPGQKRSLAKYRKALFSGFPTNRLRPQSLRSRALSAGASDEHRRGNGRKESKEGFPCEKIGKPTDHPSPNLPTNVRDFELPQSRILRQPEFRCVPNRKPSGKAPHEIPLNRSDPPAARRNVSGSGSRKPSLSLSRTGRSSSEPEPQEKALRNTENRPDSPAARQTVSGSGLRKQSLSFARTGRSSSEPKPQEKALRNTESRPDSPATRRTVSGSGSRKQSFFPCPDRPIELRAGAAGKALRKADPTPQPQDEPFPAPGCANRAFPLKEHFPMKFEPEAAGEFLDKTGNGRHRPIGSNRLPPNMPLFEKRVRRESTMALAAHALSVERPATAPGIGPSLSEAGPFVPEFGTRHGQRFIGLGRLSLPRPAGRTHGAGRKRGRIICSQTPGVGWR